MRQRYLSTAWSDSARIRLEPARAALRRRQTRGTAPPSSHFVERAVQVEGRADQRQVGECLGMVAQRLAGAAGLLGVQAQVVRVAEHPLEDEAGLFQAASVGPARAGERLDQPEGAHVEGALVAGEPVGE